jgi:site-specific recombinase XerD
MPHTIRHVSASELLRAGVNLRQVPELVGRKHLDSTSERYTRVTAHDARRDRTTTTGLVSYQKLVS